MIKVTLDNQRMRTNTKLGGLGSVKDEMGLKLWFLTVIIVAYVISAIYDFGVFDRVYDHLPGKCTRFNMSGSEDFVLFPNNHVLISSGIFFYDLLDEADKPPPGIFMLDLNSPSPSPPINLTFDGFPDSQIPSEFSPHGMGHWVTENGTMLLYFINHRRNFDTVESFVYRPLTKSLVHRKTFRDPLMYNLNDLVLVDVDKFYVSLDRYFKTGFMKSIESYARLPLAYMLYFDGVKAIVASGKLKYPNGVAKSNDGRFVFVNELLKGQVVAYVRRKDNTLESVQILPLQIANDNIFVDPNTGHLWVGILAHPLKTTKYFHDQSVPVASRILHISIDQNADLPFTDYKIEEVFSSTGKDGVVGAVTGCVYSQGKLVVGTIALFGVVKRCTSS